EKVLCFTGSSAINNAYFSGDENNEKNYGCGAVDGARGERNCGAGPARDSACDVEERQEKNGRQENWAECFRSAQRDEAGNRRSAAADQAIDRPGSRPRSKDSAIRTAARSEPGCGHASAD